MELYRSWSLWSLREGVYLAVWDTHTVEPNRPCLLVSSSDLGSCARGHPFAHSNHGSEARILRVGECSSLWLHSHTTSQLLSVLGYAVTLHEASGGFIFQRRNKGRGLGSPVGPPPLPPHGPLGD